ncbi:MAG TPA: TonB-dependent receptor [Rhizomicrobium sp.]|nr:TonB-dependent receptor [Rhizomicrobium sp.]
MNAFKAFLLCGVSTALFANAANAQDFNVPGGDLNAALSAYMKQSGVTLMFPSGAVKGINSQGAHGQLSPDAALSRILDGTGFGTAKDSSGVIAIVRKQQQSSIDLPSMQLAQAGPAPRAVETVTVTSSKLGGADVQSIPIAITALSQEELTSRQVAGGPDLIKEVPNLTFTKTNFTGYSIQIRGIGTQAISVTTDPAVAVAFNDTPFIRNHFFEQEFYDVSQVEVLRGPQGTLYGRNATAGVVNVTSAKPTDQFEAMASADIGNYKNRRFEAMLNLPIIGDKLDLRLAGEWTKRDGYSFNSLKNSPIDGRDLWSSRASLRWKPVENVTADFVWEHFSENDDRLRSSKQLCKRDPAVSEVLGQSTAIGANGQIGVSFLGQGCLPTSMYSDAAYGVPNALSLPYYGGFVGAGFGLAIGNPLNSGFEGGTRDPYASTTQSHDLRVIESTLNPEYRAKNDTLELNAEWRASPNLTVVSATGYNRDFLWSTEDYNRFNTQPGIFSATDLYGYDLRDDNLITPDGNYRCADGYLAVGMDCIAAGHNVAGSLHPLGVPTGYFCDPQLGCSNRLVGEDLSTENAWQFSQEIRLTSNFSGPFNFSAGGNYMHYETEENYYVFFNTLTMWAANDGLFGRRHPWVPFADTNAQCVPYGHQYANPNVPTSVEDCAGYIDPHPLDQLDNAGHNYFLSQNPYNLNSYAMFGEAYYNVTNDLKLTAGLRWTDDQKHFVEIPSELLTRGYGYPVTGVLDQEWKEWTGRFVANWTPKLDFTDQSMFYASYAHGYKAGGANPPGAVLLIYTTGDISNPTHPKTFEPEFNDAFEIGTKNTAFDGGLTFNANLFYYNYKGYQISYIVDRSAVNLNFDATVKGAEVQASWEPLPGLKFGFAGGYEDTRLADGSKAIDLLDRTAGNPNWLLVKPFPSQASNCVLPAYVVATIVDPSKSIDQLTLPFACSNAYSLHLDPVTRAQYSATNPVPGYPGFDPLAGTSGDPYTGQNTYNGIDYGPAPNNGNGFYKNLSGNELPNAPHYTVSLTADWTVPLSSDWAATLHSDYYWQAQSWARVFNEDNDKIRGYSTVNMALILTDASGWQFMGYVKNVFDVTAITGTFLNSDDSGLTTNIFLTDPRLFGVRVTKHFDGGDSGFDVFDSLAGKHPTAWITLGGNFAQLENDWEKFNPDFASAMPAGLPNPTITEKAPGTTFDWEGNIKIQPEDSDWVLKAGVRYGRSSRKQTLHKSLPPVTAEYAVIPTYFANYFGLPTTIDCETLKSQLIPTRACPFAALDPEFVDSQTSENETHAMLDFTLGKDVGIGLFGEDGKGTVSAGVRMAQFTTHIRAELNSDPHYNFPSPLNPFGGGLALKYGNVYDGTTDEHRSFNGIGPEITWDASQPILGNEDEGQLSIDWGMNFAVLIGRQKVNIHQTRMHKQCPGFDGFAGVTCTYIYNTPTDINRSRTVAVPNLGGYVGGSVRYSNAKINFGYRVDEFFGAMDGGQDTAKKYNRGFYGPYLNVSIGLGG